MGVWPPSLGDCGYQCPVGVVDSSCGNASLPVAIFRLPFVPSLLGRCPSYGLHDPVATAPFFWWLWRVGQCHWLCSTVPHWSQTQTNGCKEGWWYVLWWLVQPVCGWRPGLPTIEGTEVQHPKAWTLRRRSKKQNNPTKSQPTPCNVAL